MFKIGVQRSPRESASQRDRQQQTQQRLSVTNAAPAWLCLLPDAQCNHSYTVRRTPHVGGQFTCCHASYSRYPDRKQIRSRTFLKCLARCPELRGVHKREACMLVHAVPLCFPGIKTVWGGTRSPERGLRDANMHTEDTRAAWGWAKEEASCFEFCSSFGFVNHSRATNRRLCAYLRR